MTIKLSQTQTLIDFYNTLHYGHYGNNCTKTMFYSLQLLLDDLHFYNVVQSENANVVDTLDTLLVWTTLLNSNYWLIQTFG